MACLVHKRMMRAKVLVKVSSRGARRGKPCPFANQNPSIRRYGMAYGCSSLSTVTVSHPQQALPKSPGEILRYHGVPEVTHRQMIAYGQWASNELRGDHSKLSILIGKWTGEKKGGYADRVKVWAIIGCERIGHRRDVGKGVYACETP